MNTLALKPVFRADHVGSLLRPRALHDARANGGSSRIDLRAMEDASIRDLVTMQESVGLRVITDGEFRRENWWIDFISRIGGVKIVDGANPSFKRKEDAAFLYVPKTVFIAERLNRPTSILGDEFDMLRSVSRGTPKITIPSPSRMHFHGGRAAVSTDAYPDIEEFFDDVAAVYRAEIADLETRGCRYIQIDDPLFSYFIADDMRDQLRRLGEDPDMLLSRYVKLLNDCIRDRRPETLVAVHICRGNARSGWLTQGGYERIAEAIFGGLDVDSFLLEYDDERSGGFEPLRFMPRNKFVVLGLVTSKFPRMEEPARLRSRIDDATRYVDLVRLGLSPQCGFASTVEGNLITEDVQRRKLELVVSTAYDVWGSA